ncbi:hypothetical protein DB347_14010 [Opitutaceae bacterium EW11]|nr:hypothetical protein DB347_14010 [Opitutaceae bacterium EW11]
MSLRSFALFSFGFVAVSISAQTASSDKVVAGETMEIRETRLAASATSTTRISLVPRSEAGGLASAATSAADLFLADAGARSFTSTLALRGLANTPLFGDPSATVYLDDLPLGSTFALPSELTGFDSVEVFRGPGQNTRFGRAGSVGVIRFSTPASRAPAGEELWSSYGNFDARAAALRVNVAGDASDAYVAAAYRARDGYVSNTELGRRIDGRESSSGLARVRFRPSGNAEWTLLATAERLRDGVQALVPLQGPKDEVRRSAEGVTHIDDLGLALRGTYSLPFGTFAATTAYSLWNMDPATNDLSFGFAELQNTSQLRQRNLSEEVSLISDAKGQVRWSAGAFALDGRTKGGFLRSFSGFPYENSRYTTTNRSLALYGEAAIQVTPSFTLTPGLRLEENRKKMTREEIVPVGATYRLSRNSGAVLPKLVGSYAIDSAAEASVGLVTGYKPGGFSAFTGNHALASFAPERLRGVEAAVTRRSTDGTLSATLRGFGYRVRDYQVERSFQTGAQTDDYLVVNAGRAHSYGAELEVAWKPIPGLALGLDAGFTRVTLQRFTDPYSRVVYDGKRVPYSPSYDVSFRADYRAVSGWFVGASLSAVGRTYYTESEAEVFSQKSYALLGARLGYSTGSYTVALFGENLADKPYWASITPGTNHGTPGAPRTYGVELSATF